MMIRIAGIRRIASALAGLACALLGLAVTATTAFAQVLPPPGYQSMPTGLIRAALLRGQDLAPASGPGSVPSSPALTVTRTVVVGGMPGWQIALIAVGAALLTAALAVLVDHARASYGRVLEPDETREDGVAPDLLEQTGMRIRAERLTRPR
jgi:hypothetical protein